MITDDVIEALKNANLVEYDEVGKVNVITATGEILLIIYGIAIAKEAIQQMFRLLDKDQ